MSPDEVLDEVMSEQLDVDELIEHFQDEVKESDRIENPKRVNSECKGNILTDCVRDGLKEIERAAEESKVDYSIIGGIGTQLRGLADCEDILMIGDHFGRRQTADIDILVNEYEEGISMQREYRSAGKPNLDIVYSHIPGDEEIIENSERIDYSEIDERFDFEVSVATNEDLIYSKVWNPSLEKKEGTRYDIEKYAELNGYVFDIDEPKLVDAVRKRSPNLEASIDYLIRAGIDI
jgi:hypothetical protein